MSADARVSSREPRAADHAPLVSVLLLTRDAGSPFAAVLAAIARQKTPFPFEVVAIDSGSADTTLALLEGAGLRTIPVAPADFNHGATRNLGMASCLGDFVVMLVQDAEPDGDEWLARLVGPLLEDETLAGTYARQLPADGAGAVARAYLARYSASAAEPRIQELRGVEALRAMRPSQRLQACTFDNVCSCIRRTAWSRHPFPRVPIAEDVEWARAVMLDGYRLAYVPEARVRHLHDRPASYELRRTYLVHQRLRRLFGLRTVPSVVHLLAAVAVSMASHAAWLARADASWRRKARQLPRAAALAVALPLGQYLGAKSAESGRELLRVRGV